MGKTPDKKYVEEFFLKYQTSIGVKIDKKLITSGFTPPTLIWDLEALINIRHSILATFEVLLGLFLLR